MPTRTKNQNAYVHGSHNVICDVCGFKFKFEDVRKRWDGLWVCYDDWESRHPSDFFRAPRESTSVAVTRTDTDTESGGTDVGGATFPPDDPVITLSAAPTVVEGNDLVFSVALDKINTKADVTFDWTVTFGTASAADLAVGQATTGSGTIPFGSLSTEITISTLDDATWEGGAGTYETLTMTLSSIVGADSGTIAVSSSIEDDELTAWDDNYTAATLSSVGTVLDKDSGTGNYDTALGLVGHSSGKYAIEFVITGHLDSFVGVATRSIDLTDRYLGVPNDAQMNYAISYTPSNGTIWYNAADNGSDGTPPTSNLGDIITIDVDFDATLVHFYINDVLQGVDNYSFSALSPTFYPAGCINHINGTITQIPTGLTYLHSGYTEWGG